MQIHEEPSSSSTARPVQPVQRSSTWTFHDLVDAAIVFAGIPALVITILLWAVATAFGGVLATVLAMLITTLLALLGVILLVHFVESAVGHSIAYNRHPGGAQADTHLNLAIGTWAACVALVVGVSITLAFAGQLEPWHYLLLAAEIAMVGYQTWRVFSSRE